MAAGLSTALTPKPFRLFHHSHLLPKPTTLFAPSVFRHRTIKTRRKICLTVCVIMEDHKQNTQLVNLKDEVPESDGMNSQIPSLRVAEKLARKKSENKIFLADGMNSQIPSLTSGREVGQEEIGEVHLSSLAAFVLVYYLSSVEVPLVVGNVITFALSVSLCYYQVGMEFWARWAHKALWHASLWHMHESHHRPREGPFELNDVFAIINAGPAIALLSYGFFHKGLVPGLCFGAGLGITVFGMAYMFVHDGLVHKRFPVGPIANVPYFRKVAAAHQLHHSEKFNGVPYGLFLGPKELEEVGGLEELEKEIDRRIKSYGGS
uniref:beta-carotene 3-hydroxylase n=1 Tax=Fagus sylvatica TaxID=28930 RepID=A0A2N9G563_FAGSY